MYMSLQPQPYSPMTLHHYSNTPLEGGEVQRALASM